MTFPLRNIGRCISGICWVCPGIWLGMVLRLLGLVVLGMDGALVDPGFVGLCVCCPVATDIPSSATVAIPSERLRFDAFMKGNPALVPDYIPCMRRRVEPVYSAITAPLCGFTLFITNISGIRARKVIARTQKISMKANIVACLCNIP